MARLPGPAVRQLPARSVLDWTAMLCLVLAAAFWINIQLSLFNYPDVLSFNAVIAILIGVTLAIATPAMLSSLVPTTPAGQLLLSTRWKTIGLPVMTAMVGFLLWYAWQLLYGWWSAQPAVQEVQYSGHQAIMMLILMVGLPALSWVQLAPERWLQEVRQAHLVERYKVQQQTDMAILQGTMLRAQTLALKGWAGMSSGEREEFAAIGDGLVRAMDQTLGEIEYTLGQVAGQILPLARMTDSVELVEALDVIQGAIIEARPELPAAPATPSVNRAPAQARGEAAREPAFSLEPLRPDPEAAQLMVRGGSPQQDAKRAGSRGAEAQRLTPEARLPEAQGASRATEAQALSRLSVPARQNYLAAREVLTGAWTRSDLEAAVSCSKPTANRLIAEWRDAGLVVDVTDPSNRYRFVEVL